MFSVDRLAVLRDVGVGGVMGKPMAVSRWCLVETNTIV